DGTNTINVETIAGATTVLGGAGDDTINVGNPQPGGLYALAGITALLTIDGHGGSDTLNVYNTADTVGSTGTLTAPTLTGLGMATGIAFANRETLNIKPGSGNDTFTIAATPTGTTNLWTGGGDDKVFVQSISGPTTIHTGGDNDQVSVASLTDTV